MQLNITGHNVEITEALREFLNTKFAKLEQYFERINLSFRVPSIFTFSTAVVMFRHPFVIIS
jgi:ribosomal subunit interface protein